MLIRCTMRLSSGWAGPGAVFPGGRELPKIDKDSVFEVRPVYSVTRPKLMERANKKRTSTPAQGGFASGDNRVAGLFGF